MNRSSLHDLNVELGARLIDFGGWEMPVQYESVLEEHKAVRNSAGFFDVSHLGRFALRGEGAAEALSRLLCNNLDRIEPGRAQYSMMLGEDGGVVDDLIVWWLTDDEYWVMPNAVNQPRVMAAFAEHDGVTTTDLQSTTAMIAIQGPEGPDVIEDVLEQRVGRFRTKHFQWGGGPVWLAGTGYTGEPGGELITDPKTARTVAAALLRHGVRPCGLGARDTLRLEAGLPLWGQDLDETTTPIEAGLGFAVDFDHDFVGKDALERQRDDGLERRLIGFVLEGRGVPRHDYPVRTERGTGKVTSGNMSPMLETGVGMAYVAPPPEVGDSLEVEIRGRWVAGSVVKPPFHRS
ncbi:MAG: glycine cleavage system aminomethyltransferase GcvT [Actinobacteria bacterium]|nr:MAG: glycine cleavage system aminomethyltransferase GcvT [Actinomycetota bacterium]